MEAAVHHLDGAAAVSLAGELGIGTRDALWPLLHRYEGAQITLDCSGIRDVGADGLSELVAFARALDGRPVLRRPPPSLVVALSAEDALDQFVLDPS